MSDGNKRRNPFITVAFVALVVAICYFAQKVLLPIALAVLLSFLLAPIAKRLEKWKLGRIGAVTVTVGLAFALITAIGWLVTLQVVDLLERLPNYEQTLVHKIEAIRVSTGGILGRVEETADRIEKAVAGDRKDAPEKGAAPPSAEPKTGTTHKPAADRPQGDGLREAFAAEPVPVRIVDTTFLPVRILRDFGPLMEPLGTLAIVIVFVVFFLIQREDLRDRLIRLAGTGHVFVTTQALDDAGQRVSRYLLTQLFINAGFGLAAGTGLYFIGLPNAPLWGLLAALLRFIPYLGIMIGAVTPIALSLAIFDGWPGPLATVMLFVVLEVIAYNILEPLLFGHSTGISAVGIVASAVFWTWLWGAVGLVLATPLTVCLTVLSRHMPQFAFLNILLAEEPPLELRYRFYQRLLAKDYDEASDVAEEHLRAGSLIELYDELFVPALALAERDRDAGRLAEDQESFVYESIEELVEGLAEKDQRFGTARATVEPEEENHTDAYDDAGRSRASLRVLCLPAEDEADRIAAVMFAQLLARSDHWAETASAFNVREETLERIEAQEIDCVVVSTIAPHNGLLRSRHACRRLRRQFPALKILVAYWKAPSTLAKTREHLLAAGADEVAASLQEGIDKVEQFAPQLQKAGL
jgi:predicted PurR-regulated permease PerM